MKVRDYVAQVLGKVVWTEQGYGAQCVGAFKDCCENYIGCGAYPTSNGYADGYWYQDAPECFTKVSVNELKNGDWVIWARGCDNEHGNSHIAMFVDGKQLSQNQFGHDEMTLCDCNDWDMALGALRWNGWEDEPEPTPEPSSDCQLSAGTLQCIVEAVNVRTQPSTDAEIVDQYEGGMTVNISDIVHTNGYYWGHYTSYEGEEHYVALQSDDGNVYWQQISGYANEIHEGDIVTPTSRVNANGVECDEWVLNATFTVGNIDGDKCELLNNGVLTDWWKLADLKRD